MLPLTRTAKAVRDRKTAQDRASRRRGMAVCDCPGRWTFDIAEIMPWGGLRHLGDRDSETEAADLICEHFDWITDRGASLLVEQVCFSGWEIRGSLSIGLKKVAP